MKLEYELDLDETSLSPLDYLSVSFFRSSLTGKESIDLDHSTIDDLDVKYLPKYVVEVMAESGISGVVGLSLEKQLSKFPAYLLDRPCTESHLGKLVHMIDTESMVMLATDLELSAVEVHDLQTAWPRNPAIQRLEMFKKWRQKNQSKATYRYVVNKF
jgi:hypothetical protein